MSTTVQIGPNIKTALPGWNAKRILDGDERLISPSYTRSYPLVARRPGRGVMIEDVDGNEFMDFAAGIAVFFPPDIAIPKLSPPFSASRPN